MAVKERDSRQSQLPPRNGKSQPIDALQAEIDEKRGEIRSDQFAISVGELSSLYRDGELNIHPEFQKYFRWSDERKSKLIESLLIGIPLPSITVSQAPDGKWDLLDHLQTISSIFEYMGILRDAAGQPVSPFACAMTGYLRHLKGKSWSGGGHFQSLTGNQKLLVKRAKTDVKILLWESDESATFRIYERNAGESALSEQQVRNELLSLANGKFYAWLAEMANDTSFCDCVPLTAKDCDEDYGMELVLRFLLLRSLPAGYDWIEIGDIGDFLTRQMLSYEGKFSGDRPRQTETFRVTFDLLAEVLKGDAFRRYDTSRQSYTGGFLMAAFEVVAFGIGYGIDRGVIPDTETVRAKVAELWKNRTFAESWSRERAASARIPATLKLGRELFSP